MLKKISPLLIIIALSACTFTAEKSTELVKQDNKTSHETTPKKEASELNFEFGYNYESPKWENLKKDIEAKTSEQFQSIYAPRSNDDEELIYVSTSKPLAELGPETSNINKIYSYNLSSKELKELYVDESAYEGPYKEILATIGRDGIKLILMPSTYDFSPGPCFTPFNDFKAAGLTHVYLNLDSPQEGLRPYLMPKALIEKGKEIQRVCQEENEFEVENNAS